MMSSKRTVVLNGTYLFILQVVNYGAPLVTIPYLVRVLGVSNYGMVALASSAIQYFVNVTSYGFDFTITRKISLESDAKEISRIFSTTMLTKACISVLGFLVLVLLLFFVPVMSRHWTLYVVTYIAVIANVALPIWFFQGIQKMMSITLANVLARALSLALIFSFIKEPSDYLSAALIQSSSLLVAGVIALAIAIFRFKITFCMPRWSDILAQLRDGGYVFLSSLSGTVYSQGAVLVTGFVAGPAAAGYYSLAQKVGSTLIGLAHPVVQAVYPYLCRLFADSRHSFAKVKRTMLVAGFSGSVLMALGTFVFASYIDKILTGESGGQLQNILQVYSLIIVFTSCNVILNPFLLSMEKYKPMQRMYTGVAILFVAISVPLTAIYSDVGMAWSIVLVESAVTVGSLFLTRQVQSQSLPT